MSPLSEIDTDIQTNALVEEIKLGFAENPFRLGITSEKQTGLARNIRSLDGWENWGRHLAECMKHSLVDGLMSAYWMEHRNKLKFSSAKRRRYSFLRACMERPHPPKAMMSTYSRQQQQNIYEDRLKSCEFRSIQLHSVVWLRQGMSYLCNIDTSDLGILLTCVFCRLENRYFSMP